MKHIFIISAIILLSVPRLSAQNITPAKNASKYFGYKIKVCDKVYGSSHTSDGTLLYLGEEYPKQLLTLFIKTADLSKFKGRPDIDFKGKDICITGVVVSDKGKPEIVLTDPKQIKPYMVDSPVKQKSSVN
ncbi:hypothetical protein ACPPVU_04500 [Mucilaginibacter sp. McL0603]|uniref:hypothetical protein n=1 Tax=Mucilaginibacter sp. McL0603 TaxID=3415670 RepID=UPI003CF213A1